MRCSRASNAIASAYDKPVYAWNINISCALVLSRRGCDVLGSKHRKAGSKTDIAVYFQISLCGDGLAKCLILAI